MTCRKAAEGVQAMQKCSASVDGELYDPAKWGNFYKSNMDLIQDPGTQSTDCFLPNVPVQQLQQRVWPVVENTEVVAETTAHCPRTISEALHCNSRSRCW